MIKYASYIFAFALLISCRGTMPIMEECTLLRASIICTDKRLDEPPAGCERVSTDTYECPIIYGLGYQCTSPGDLGNHMDWDEMMIEKMGSCGD